MPNPQTPGIDGGASGSPEPLDSGAPAFDGDKKLPLPHLSSHTHTEDNEDRESKESLDNSNLREKERIDSFGSCSTQFAFPSGISHEQHRSINGSTPQTETSAEPQDVENDTATRTSTNDAPIHTVFNKNKRLFIVFMAAVGGFFSPLSANVYFPALNPIAADLNVSSSVMNLTLTSYMIFQGLAPTIFGEFADVAGRRPAYIIGFTIYIGACIGCALQDSFATLFILRCLQSTGSSGTIALASGVGADVATSAERGKYMGWIVSGAMVAPAMGPVLGGILSQFLGWRSIFWFLVISAGIYMIPLIIAFPETGRNVVGNGSIPPPRWNMSLLNYLAWRREEKARLNAPNNELKRTISRQSLRSARSALASKRKLCFPNPFNVLKVIAEKDVGLLLAYNSLVYTSFYDLIASLPYLFKEIYQFNDLQIGLAFIPFGVGCFIAPILNGRLLDWNFRRVAKQAGIPVDKKKQNTMRGFPIERARFQVALPLVIIGNAALLCYGWVVEVEAPLPAPLVLTFITGLTITGSFNVMSVTLVDYYPSSPSTATAANNLCRCLLGAAGTAVIIEMINGMGRGWCFTFIAAVVALCTPILGVLMRYGPKWREERWVRDEKARVKRREQKREGEGGEKGQTGASMTGQEKTEAGNLEAVERQSHLEEEVYEHTSDTKEVQQNRKKDGEENNTRDEDM